MEIENNNFGKGKTFLAPVIAIALFMLLVFGATFAYFTATINTTNVANIKATLPQAGTTLTTTSTPCVITVAASDMTEAQKGKEVGNTTCTLTVNYKAETGVVCTYDVVLEETSPSTAKYALSVAGATEFTGKIKSVTGTGTANDQTTPAQMDTLVGKTVAHATATGTGSAFNQVFTFEEVFYNIDGNQNDRAGKTYTFNLKASNIQC